MTEMEAQVQAAIAKVCGIDAALITPDAELTALGVDSLAAAEVLVELEIRLDRQLPVDVLRHLDTVATVHDIASALDAAFDRPPAV